MSEKDDQSRGDQPKGARRPPVNRHNYHNLIDQIFAKAEADGLLDNLPGQGKPLNLGDDALVPDDQRLGLRMLKSSGFAPPWVEARREIDEERAKLAHWLADANRRWPYLGARARTAMQVTYRRKLDDVQRLILNFNLTAPPGVAHIEGVRVIEELEKLGH
jgi:DnaJ homolog subfamily C member 28